MAQLKIVSNPYQRKALFYKRKDDENDWAEIVFHDNQNSNLVKDKIGVGFLTFQVKEIIDTMLSEYDDGNGIDLIFEGTDDEYQELRYLLTEEQYVNQIRLEKSSIFLENASDVLLKVVTIFERTIEVMPRQLQEMDEFKKFKESSSSQIPLIVVGNYSSGKSTFINALVGSEILPNSDRPMTAKIFQISHHETSNMAKISFDYNDQKCTIIVREDNFTLDDDKKIQDSQFLEDLLKGEMEKLSTKSLSGITDKILTVLNRVNDEEHNISELIQIEFPFKKGILADSKNKFVIFDTPGANSSSNYHHFEILKDAIKNMSNGLPIFVSEYNSLDTNDNERLYQKIRGMDGIDDRFTLIVVNKADAASLTSGGFTQETISNLMSQSIPKNLYSEGIYFVSSIMGLGYKNNGTFIDPNYDRIYKKSINEFTNNQEEYYQELYHYNILPAQLKERAVFAAKNEKNLIYANSGLFSIENEIETFANKYSAYNKCQQSKYYLDRIIQKTQDTISQITRETNEEKIILEQKLETDKQHLIAAVETSTAQAQQEFNSDYDITMSGSSADYFYEITKEEIIDLFNSYKEQVESELNFRAAETVKSTAREKLTDNLKQAVQFNNLDKATEAWKQLKGDGKAFWDSKTNLDKQVNEINKETSERVLHSIKRDYEQKADKAKYSLLNTSRVFWNEKAKEFKKILSDIIGNADVLDSAKRQDIQQLILSFENIQLNQDLDTVFVMEKLSRAFHIGNFKIGNANKIDENSIVKKYKSLMQSDVTMIKDSIQEDHRKDFIHWSRSLVDMVNENIVEFNPDLQRTNALILKKQEEIAELGRKLQILEVNKKEISQLIDWHNDN